MYSVYRINSVDDLFRESSMADTHVVVGIVWMDVTANFLIIVGESGNNGVLDEKDVTVSGVNVEVDRSRCRRLRLRWWWYPLSLGMDVFLIVCSINEFISIPGH